jgi:hypothetical protein
MKLFNYNEDPLYDIAASILAGKNISEETLSEASANDTLDGFGSAPEIIAALLKLPGVKDHLRKIKAKPYFDDTDFVVASKTAIRDAIFNPKIKLADLVRAVMAEKGDFAKPEKEAMPNRVIAAVDSEAAANKLLDLIKTNNAKASSKDMKVKVQKFARKGGFKLYITGNSVAAIGPYKKLAEESDLYEDITLQEKYTAKFPLAKKAIEAVGNLDEDEMEDFLFALDSFFEEGEMSDYKESSNISALIYKAAQIWKNRNERYA